MAKRLTGLALFWIFMVLLFPILDRLLLLNTVSTFGEVLNFSMRAVSDTNWGFPIAALLMAALHEGLVRIWDKVVAGRHYNFKFLAWICVALLGFGILRGEPYPIYLVLIALLLAMHVLEKSTRFMFMVVSAVLLIAL